MKPLIIKLICFFVLINFSCNSVNEKVSKLSVDTPENAGMSSERLQRIDKVITQYIDNKWIPGAVGIIARNGKIVYHKSFGYRDIENNDPAKVSDIYRIASMTKALTIVCIMMLYEEGNFLLDDPVSDYIPEFKNPVILDKFNEQDTTYTTKPSKKEITIRHLLTHTAGIPYNIPKSMGMIYEKAGINDGLHTSQTDLRTSILKLAKLPLLHEPGKKFTYGLNTDILGYLIEVFSGMKFNDFMQQRLLDPLGMNDTHFNLPETKKDRLAVVYADDQNSDMQPSTEKGYNYPVDDTKYYSGGAGLSSTVLDYAIFLQMLINNGTYEGKQYLSRKTIELITTDQLGDLPDDGPFGLGFGLITKENSGKTLCSVGNYQWGGYFSTSYWLDPSEQLIAVFFTQMYPNEHWQIHQKLQVLTYQAIAD